ncbi:MAG: hypothetical protein JWM57_394 [Phycisphaerales bacterium]|nr:hypothetical protein [Phycisphaerales bacterium]
MIEFKCRHCFTKYSVRPALAGRTAECKACGRRFMVPYASAIVRLGDEDLTVDDESAMNEVAVGDESVELTSPLELAPEAKASVSELDRLAAFSGKRLSKKKRSDISSGPAMIPLPAAVAELWLPVGLLVTCLGLAAYVVLDCVLNSDGRLGGLALVAFGIAALMVIAFRLTIRTLEGSAHTLDLAFSNAIALQTAACISVPVLGGVVGLIYGGVAGTAIGAVLGLLLCPMLMTMVFQLPAGKGMQSGVLASLAFAVGYACSAVLVAAVANVMFTVWSVNLPWKVHTATETLAADTAMPATTRPAAAVPVPVVPAPAAAAAVPASFSAPGSPSPANSSAPPALATPAAIPPETAFSVNPVLPPTANPALPGSASPAQTAPPAGSPPVASVVPPTNAPGSPLPAPPAPTPESASAAALRGGLDLLYANKFADAAAAMKAFQATLPKKAGRLADPALIDSLHIQAVAYMRLGTPAQASLPMQRVMESGVTERSAVINAAVCDIQLKTYAMRAAKNLKALAAAHPDDELAVSLWGVALDTAATRQKLVRAEEYTAEYIKANALLEQTRGGGQHHWGTRWVTAMEWHDIESRRSSATAQLNEAKRILRDANVQMDNAQANYRRTNVVVVGRPMTTFEQDDMAYRKRQANARIDDCRRKVDSAEAALEQAQGAMPRPTWVFDLQPVDPQLTEVKTR